MWHVYMHMWFVISVAKKENAGCKAKQIKQLSLCKYNNVYAGCNLLVKILLYAGGKAHRSTRVRPFLHVFAQLTSVGPLPCGMIDSTYRKSLPPQNPFPISISFANARLRFRGSSNDHCSYASRVVSNSHRQSAKLLSHSSVSEYM